MKKFFEKLIETIKSAVKPAAVTGALALASVLCPLSSARAQGIPPGGLVSINGITLPFATLDQTTTSTNLAQGWSTIFTNITTSTTWNSSSNAFISVTNTIFTTNTTFADSPAYFQKDLAVFAKFQTSGAGTNTLTFARFMDSTTVDTNNTATVVAGVTAAGFLLNATNFPATWLGGWSGVRLITVGYVASGSTTMTNSLPFKYEVKRNAF
jgi:hypothetical protein